ncbi:MAG: XRE family transcriptional regulator [Pirellulales bacterium]
MRLSLRLAKLVNYTPDKNKRPGIIKAIVEATGLDRHLVSNLLRNVARGIPLDALSRLCEFLVDQGYCSPDQLPGALFGVEAETFWELLARRQRLELCVGVRSAEQPEWPERAWVVASDAVLVGELLNGVSTLGGTTQLRADLVTGAASDGESASPAYAASRGSGRPPHPEHLRQSLVWSPGTATSEVAIERAQEIYREFGGAKHDKALVCLGSMKSNPVAELVMASAFECSPFVSQDRVSRAVERSCPFYLRYRDRDPHPESCWGGTRLAGDLAADKPGLYYEQAAGDWAFCASDEQGQDAAFVFYVNCAAQGWLEMVLGGFSGRATRLLAKTLASRAEEFWPPVFEAFGKQYGAYVVKFASPRESDQQQDLLRTDVSGDPTIIPLDKAVFERRLTADDSDDGDPGKE